MRKKIQITSLLLAIFIMLTISSMNVPPKKLSEIVISDQKTLVLDSNYSPLITTYMGRWNEHQLIPIQEVPALIQKAFIMAEDKRYYKHFGVDWIARFHAVIINLKAMKVIRGASTITEQVIRMIHPRPRNIWSRWIEGLEATWLEFNVSKDEILEFYLNQVPYAANRRGIVQAASYYFDRDLKTLSIAESIALAALLRSPSRLDLYKNPQRIVRPLESIARRMKIKIDLNEYNFKLQKSKLETKAPHFVNFVNKKINQKRTKVVTTLDSEIQNQVQELVDKRVKDLKKFKVKNGAALVVDHTQGNILSWVNAGNMSEDKDTGHIDAILTPRQPGSSLKPFLYALAIQKGYTAGTMINDTPLELTVGMGIHKVKNYSRQHYGLLSLRQSLANSLNVPAIKIVKNVGVENFYNLMKNLGFRGLDRSVQFYGEGLVLGNAEVTLFELVQAYSVLANKGNLTKLAYSDEKLPSKRTKKIFTPEITSIISNILSDRQARSLEFGSSGLLDFPYQTAIKTGTSTDYRDTWTIAYNDRYIVGVWMGNLDGRSTHGLTGAKGPALLVRGIFSLLNAHRKVMPLFLSHKLVKRRICSKLYDSKECIAHDEFFIRGTETKENTINEIKRKRTFQIIRPQNNLKMVLDPRVPKHLRSYEFKVIGHSKGEYIKWILNGKTIKSLGLDKHIWNLKKGTHKLIAELYLNTHQIGKDSVSFLVKD